MPPRAPLAQSTPPTPARRLSVRAGVLAVLAVVAVVALFWQGSRWIVEHSDEWTLESGRRVVAKAELTHETRSALTAELQRLESAHDAGTIPYSSLFAALQRIVEGPLVWAAEAQHAAERADTEAVAAAAFRRLARGLHESEFPSERAMDLLIAARRASTPAELAGFAEEAESIADDLSIGPEPWRFDPAAEYRALVDATLAGSPPAELPRR